jgi:hypothetical protein
MTARDARTRVDFRSDRVTAPEGPRKKGRARIADSRGREYALQEPPGSAVIIVE